MTTQVTTPLPGPVRELARSTLDDAKRLRDELWNFNEMADAVAEVVWAARNVVDTPSEASTRQILVYRKTYQKEWISDNLLVAFPADATVIWEAGQGCVSIRSSSGSVLAAYRGASGFRDIALVTDTEPAESAKIQEESVPPQP